MKKTDAEIRQILLLAQYHLIDLIMSLIKLQLIYLSGGLFVVNM